MSKQLSDLPKREVRFALSLLKALHANVNNYYLVIAVIAWMRDASGEHYKGTNPLGIHNGRRYASLEAAAYATAKLLLSRGDYYKTLIHRIHGQPRADADQQKQAFDFLTLLAYTDWDAMHFGVYNLGYNPLRHEYIRTVDLSNEGRQKNRLLTIMYKLWGHPFTVPGEPAQPAPKQGKPNMPNPMGERHGRQNVVYIEPYGALSFYEATHKDVPLVTSR